MAEVELREVPDGVEIAVGSEVLHTVGSRMEAEALSSWVRFQLQGGASVVDLQRMLRGEPPKKTSGTSDDAVATALPAEEPAPAEAPGVDASILDGSIGELKEALAGGAHDAVLADLLAAETAGKARKGALGAIEARMEEVG